MQCNKVSQFCTSVTDAQSIITHYLALSFGENGVSSNRKKFYEDLF